MKILSIELNGYKRLMQNHVDKFKMDITSVFQIIIGSNGSGKSSVLKELSPLPATPKEYTKGGSKKICIEHKGNYYSLVSDFTHGQKHAFIEHGSVQNSQGEDANPGGTITVQRELVKNTFGLDAELFDILTGTMTFSKMPANKRREIIVMLSGSDLDYVIGIFNKIRSHYRDTQGAIKHLKNRIASETEKLLDSETLSSYKRLSHQLQTELDLMLSEKLQINDSSDNLFRKIVSHSVQLTEYGTKTLSGIPKTIYGYNSLAEVNEAIDKYKTLQAVTHTACNLHKEELSNLLEVVETMRKAGVNGVEEINRTLDELRELLQEKSSLIIRFRDMTGQPKDILGQTFDVIRDIGGLIADITAFNGGFTKEDFVQKKTLRETIEGNINKAKLAFDKTDHRLLHASVTNDIECPKCNHQWKPGYTPRELDELKERHSKIHTYLESKRKELEEVDKWIDNYELYLNTLRRFKRFMESYPLLKPFWDVVVEEQWITRKPNFIIAALDRWQKDVEKKVEISEILEKIANYENALKSAKLLNNDESTQWDTRLESLQQSIEVETRSIVKYQKIHDQLKEYSQRLESIYNREAKFKEQMGVLDNLTKEYIETQRQELIRECISEHQLQLSHLNNDIHKASIALGIVNDIEKDIVELEQKLSHLGIILDELSPVDGLIADQIKGFMEALVSQINAIIAGIWTYDMEVQPCGLTSGELDYKFPVVVRNHELVVPDVSETSSAQTDVINFAFKLVVMLYCGFTDYPIHLDELAPTLDEQHRQNIMRYVKEMVENNRVSQLFMISHYFESFGAFTSAEICVMDSSNLITIPGSFNKHVTLQ